jgi:ketosteroid isomerase-like protein
MKASLIAGAILFSQVFAGAQEPVAPWEAWTSAVTNGDRASLAKLYSVSPQAVPKAGKTRISVNDELAFWADLKRNGLKEINPQVLEVTTANGHTSLVLRISANSGNSRLYAGARQEWAHQADGWKIIASVRSPAFTAEPNRTLPQPATPNVSLYPDPRDAEAELKSALTEAGMERKRVLVVFGGNWCYDCHVLDTTFHSKAFAPLVEANFVVVHINIGDEGKDNNHLAARLGVALDKGVPSLGVLEPNGKVVYAQKNGEFEATEKIGPQDVRAFLEKWKPRRG